MLQLFLNAFYICCFKTRKGRKSPDGYICYFAKCSLNGNYYIT